MHWEQELLLLRVDLCLFGASCDGLVHSFDRIHHRVPRRPQWQLLPQMYFSILNAFQVLKCISKNTVNRSGVLYFEYGFLRSGPLLPRHLRLPPAARAPQSLPHCRLPPSSLALRHDDLRLYRGEASRGEDECGDHVSGREAQLDVFRGRRRKRRREGFVVLNNLIVSEGNISVRH